MLTPVNNQAKTKSFNFPEKNLSMPPVFEMNEGNLLMKGNKNEYSFIFDIDKNKWITPVRVKAGA